MTEKEDFDHENRIYTLEGEVKIIIEKHKKQKEDLKKFSIIQEIMKEVAEDFYYKGANDTAKWRSVPSHDDFEEEWECYIKRKEGESK